MDVVVDCWRPGAASIVIIAAGTTETRQKQAAFSEISPSSTSVDNISCAFLPIWIPRGDNKPSVVPRHDVIDLSALDAEKSVVLKSVRKREMDGPRLD